MNKGRAGAIVDIRDLGTIPRILFATDGSINHILEAYAGEPVDLARLSSRMPADPSSLEQLGGNAGERSLQRFSLLRGRRSGRVFVHADSVVMLDRLPEPVGDMLLRSGASLLKLLTQHRVGTFRESIGEWEGTDDDVAAHFGIDPSETLVARTYQIVLARQPVAWVTETFPKSGFS